MRSKAKKKIRCVLIAGGKYHDIDYARLELLKLLFIDDQVRVRVFEDYENIPALSEADFLVSYTCDVIPSLEAQEALRAFVERGGRWYALHGTNSILRWLPNGLVRCPRWAPLFMDTLGSQFIAHPAIEPFTVTVADPNSSEYWDMFRGDGAMRERIAISVPLDTRREPTTVSARAVLAGEKLEVSKTQWALEQTRAGNWVLHLQANGPGGKDYRLNLWRDGVTVDIEVEGWKE